VTTFGRPSWLMEMESGLEKARNMVDDLKAATNDMDNNHKANKPIIKGGEIVHTMCAAMSALGNQVELVHGS